MNEERIYVVKRTGEGVRCEMHLPQASRPVAHAVLHSPAGFETGYGGSGPADMAASILADFLGVSAQAVEQAWRPSPFREDLDPRAYLVLRLHQDFKNEWIGGARLEAPGESYVVAGESIRRWIEKKQLFYRKSQEVGR